MDPDHIRALLADVQSGAVSVDDGMERLRLLPYENLTFARLDHHRHLRHGFPEVIFCQGKTTEQVALIASRLMAHTSTVMGTRATTAVFEAVQGLCPDARYFPDAHIFLCGTPVARVSQDIVVVASGGTADQPVSEEAAVTAEIMGNRVVRLYDVGVAGLHRLLDNLEELRRGRVVIAVAGMEGALASVVGGLVSVPVIAVPTSVGYGASFHGVAALLAMLNSCASGVGVVNIDNGFGAGYLASMINRQATNIPCE